MSGEQINLLDIFKQVSKTMKTNQDALNEADDYNHDQIGRASCRERV